MPKTIQQRVTLPAPAESLYDMYLDSRVHGAFTGSPVTIHSKPGSEFQAFGDMLSGRMLYTVPKRLIVQSWRAKDWKPEDLDSILVLTFWPEGNSGRIELVHVNVADQDFQGVNEGWEKYYWKPWREYLQKGSSPR
jgi:activator of HSP90 ATPase